MSNHCVAFLVVEPVVAFFALWMSIAVRHSFSAISLPRAFRLKRLTKLSDDSGEFYTSKSAVSPMFFEISTLSPPIKSASSTSLSWLALLSASLLILSRTQSTVVVSIWMVSKLDFMPQWSPESLLLWVVSCSDSQAFRAFIGWCLV